MTTYELLEAAKTNAEQHRANSDPASAREFALAITAIEDAQMRYTRGVARMTFKFAPADLEAQPDA